MLKIKDLLYEGLSDDLKPYYEKSDCCYSIVKLKKDKAEKQQEIERLNNIINELEKYIHNELILDFYNDDMPCELIINKMEKMIKKLKEE